MESGKHLSLVLFELFHRDIVQKFWITAGGEALNLLESGFYDFLVSHQCISHVYMHLHKSKTLKHFIEVVKSFLLCAPVSNIEKHRQQFLTIFLKTRFLKCFITTFLKQLSFSLHHFFKILHQICLSTAFLKLFSSKMVHPPFLEICLTPRAPPRHPFKRPIAGIRLKNLKNLADGNVKHYYNLTIIALKKLYKFMLIFSWTTWPSKLTCWMIIIQQEHHIWYRGISSFIVVENIA